jgi:hypothetical protein
MSTTSISQADRRRPRKAVSLRTRALTAAAGLAAVCGIAVAAAPVASAQVNPYTGTAMTYHLNAPYSGCVLTVGDRYEGTGGPAVGEADISCPTSHTYRILVDIYYSAQYNGTQYTVPGNNSGTPYYGTYDEVYTPAYCGNLYWTVYAWISIDGSPYSGYFASAYSKHYDACNA